MGCVGSCLGSCLAQCGCSCLDKVCGRCKSKGGSLIPYMILFMLSTAVALVLRYWGQPLLINLYIYTLDVCDTGKCLGIGGVNRISFALFVFFFFHWIMLKFISNCSRLDSQSWWMKLFIFIILLIGAWLIPNEFYSVYMQIARVVSGFFLVLQLLILIDFGYQWNQSWTSEEKGWNKAVLGVSVFMYLASLTFFILLLIFFGECGTSHCQVQKFFMAFTFVLTFLLTGLSVSNLIGEGGGLLPAGVVTLYSYWLLFTALTSDPSDCNKVSSRSRELAPLIIGLILTTASVGYAAWSVATNTTLFPAEATENLNSSKSDDLALDSDAKDIERDNDDEDDEPTDSQLSSEKAALSARFHLLMACASMYVCMLLSSWGSQASAEDPNSNDDLSLTNMWIKIVTQWVCIGLYVWTLIAPKVCPGREFSS